MLEGLRQKLEKMVPRVQRVMRQTTARIFAGDTHAEGKIVSLFEPSTEVIRKGKAGKPTNSARWSNCKKRRTRLSSRTRSMISGQRFGPADCRDRNASSNAGVHAALGGGRCRFLLGQK